MASAYPWAVIHGGMILANTVSEDQMTAMLNYLHLYQGYDGEVLSQNPGAIEREFKRVPGDMARLIRVDIIEAQIA